MDAGSTYPKSRTAVMWTMQLFSICSCRSLFTCHLTAHDNHPHHLDIQLLKKAKQFHMLLQPSITAAG